MEDRKQEMGGGSFKNGAGSKRDACLPVYAYRRQPSDTSPDQVPLSLPAVYAWLFCHVTGNTFTFMEARFRAVNASFEHEKLERLMGEAVLDYSDCSDN